MSTPPSRRCTAVFGVLAALAIPASQARAEGRFVIPPQREATIGTMLGLGETLAGNCRLGDVVIKPTHVLANYTCGGQAARLELRHPTAKAPPLARTEQFLIVAGEPAPPAPLVDAVVGRVRAAESNWRWERTTDFEPVAELPSVPTEPGDLTDGQDEYNQAARLNDAQRYREAYDITFKLARRHPTPNVLLLLATLAAVNQGEPGLYDQVAAEADAAPKDVLLQFVAGIMAHYRGHHGSSARSDKEKYYRLSLHFLERCLPEYDSSARVWLYIAVSHYRLGEQALAEKYIEQAIARGGSKDPDVYYCRAEIFHQKDPVRSAEDLKRYLDMMASPTPREKEKRVRRIYEQLLAVNRGELPMSAVRDAFDPVQQAQAGTTVSGSLVPLSRVVVPIALLSCLAFGVALWRRRRARP